VDEGLFMAYYLFWNFGFNVVVLLFSNAMSINFQTMQSFVTAQYKQNVTNTMYYPHAH